MSQIQTVTDLFLHRNELGQTFRELLAERIRAQGIAWNADHPEMFGWRGKPWMDGIRIDLDEPDQVEYLVKGVTAVIREAVGEDFWAELIDAYLARELANDLTTPAPTPAHPSEEDWRPVVMRQDERKFEAARARLAERFDAPGAVNQVAVTLMAAWEVAEGKPVTASHVATFADMAAAVFATGVGDTPHPTASAGLAGSEGERDE